MPLSSLNPIGFIPTGNAENARAFYAGKLGLTLVSDDNFAMVFRIGQGNDLMLRVVRVHVKEFTPVPFTIFGWETSGIEAKVDELAAAGIDFVRYSAFQQDDRGIWTAPNGDKIAWFKDPDGNLLSLSQHKTV
jgi:catechol 2,3-dioxygenase-like lactoylglutathione lyase family enzyme